MKSILNMIACFLSTMSTQTASLPGVDGGCREPREIVSVRRTAEGMLVRREDGTHECWSLSKDGEWNRTDAS